MTLFLYSFSYGGITSFVAVYAEQLSLPRALYFTVFCLTIVATRPFIGRYADRVGHARVIVPCLAMIVVGVWLLAVASSQRDVRDLGGVLRPRLRLGVSDLRRAPDAPRRRSTAAAPPSAR